MMNVKLPRRKFLNLAASATALQFAPYVARAQTYPLRPVRIVVPFPPAGTTDIVARLIGQWMSERLGQQFFVENRVGANGNIGTEVVVRAPPDGYTLLQVGAANVINTAFYDKLNYDLIRDIAPVASIVRSPLVMEVHPSVPANSFSEFVIYAKANPGKINMASAGIGSAVHMTGELFKMMTGLNMVHVPYRGAGPALIDMIGGQVHVMFDVLPSSIEHIRSGKLRPLAVTTAARSEALPHIPTVAEFVPGYEASAWHGIGTPKNTPAQIIEMLNKEINAALTDSKMKAHFAELGGMVIGGSSTDFGKLIAAETEKWAKVVKFSGAKPE